jgi:hypothetical protein
MCSSCEKPNPQQPTSPNNAAASPTVWTTSSLIRIGQTDTPGTSSSITLYAAKNETYSFEIGMQAPAGGLTSVNLTASDLAGPNGAVIAASNIALFRESYINVTSAPPYYWTGTSDGTNPPTGPGLYADGLIPLVDLETGQPANGGTIQAVPFSLAAGLNQPIWVDVSVPSSAVAGIYTGTVTIDSDGAESSVALTLQVWHFTLPVVPSFKSSIQATSLANRTLFMSHELLRERLSPDWPEGPNEQTLIAQWGLNSTDLPFSTGLNISNCATTPIPSAPSIAQFQAAVAQHQNNILLYDFSADEIGACTQVFPGLIQWAANMHQAGVDNLVTVQPVPALENDGTGTGRSAVDIWTVLPLEWDNAQSATGEMTRVLDKGDSVWSYNVLVQDGYSPKMEINFDPIDYRIAVGFISQSLGITGFQQWSVDQWTSNPWNVMTVSYNGVPSDGLLVYPGPYVGLLGVAPSMRLKWLREGVNDYEYVQILKGMGQGSLALQQAATVGQDWHTWTRSSADIEAVRIALGNAIDQLSQANGQRL